MAVNPNDVGSIKSYFPGYASWNDPNSILADFRATGGAGKGPAAPASPQDSANNIVQSSIDNWTKLVKEASSKFSSYQQSNPFIVDDVLKQNQQQAQEQLDPYYNEQLGNYLLGVQRKVERGATDTQSLLQELSGQTQNYTQDTQMKLDNALQKAGEGYADAGLYNSGQRLRTQGLDTAGSQLQTDNFLRGQDYRANQANLGQQRLTQDYGLGNLQGQNVRDVQGLDLTNPGVGTNTAIDIRNLERQRTSDESTLASQLTNQAGQKYVTGFNAALPPEYGALSNGTDLLKQIGIYS